MFGCDLIDIIYHGAGVDFYRGDRDRFAINTGYIMGLISSGIVAHTAYLTLSSGNVDAWKVVEQTYKDKLVEISHRIRGTLDFCNHMSWENARHNAWVAMRGRPWLSNPDMSWLIYSMLKRVHP